MGKKIIQKKCPGNIINILRKEEEKNIFMSGRFIVFYSFCHWAYFISTKLFQNFGRLYLGQKTA